MDACSKLATAIDLAAAQTTSPRQLLVTLGTAAAGIRPGPLALLDLARGGRNHFPGRGMASEFDDDSDGQVRHFAGIATSVVRVGPVLTRWLSIVMGRDAPSSPDGKLTDLAVEFASLLLRRELAAVDGADWVRSRLCA